MTLVGIGISFHWGWGWYDAAPWMECDAAFMLGPVILLFEKER